MSTIYARVTRIAGWAGWCSPCQREDRPLVLTRSGRGGVRAWLAGLGDDDRLLLLTCRVCGGWQFVPAREEDDPEVVLTDEPVEASVLEAVGATVHEARTVQAAVPMPVPVPLPRAGVPAAPEASDAAEPAAVVPAPRPSVPRIVTVPDAEPELAAVSPAAVAAAGRVLAAARAQTQRTPSTAHRNAPLDRTRRTRSGPTPARATRPAPAPAPEPYPSIELPPSIALPAGTSQVVLATAS